MKYIFLILASTTSLSCQWRPETSASGLGSLGSGFSALAVKAKPTNPLFTEQTKQSLERLGFFGDAPSLRQVEELYNAKRHTLQEKIDQLEADYRRAEKYARRCKMAKQLPRTYKPS